MCPLKFLIAALFAKIASLCLPSVFPYLSPCSCLQLLSSTCPSHLGALGRMNLHLFSTCRPHLSPTLGALGRRKECESVWLPNTVSRNFVGQFPKIRFRTSLALRSDLVKLAASQGPAQRGFGKARALQWSAAWFAAAVVVACAAASG